MLTAVIYDLSKNALPVIVYMVIIIIGSFILYFSISEISFNKKIIMFDAMFANLDKKQKLAFTGILIRTFMIVYSTAGYNLDNYILYMTIAIMSDLLFIAFNLRKAFFEIPSIVAQIILIYIIHLMNQYREQVNNDISVAIIQVLLITFLVVYSLFFLIRDFEGIISKKNKEKKHEVKARES